MAGKKKPTRVAEVLAAYLSGSGLGDRLEQVSVLDDWADRVGERIDRVASPLRVTDDVLFVGVQSSAWLMELRMMEAEIRRRLNEGRSQGRIEKIRFVLEADEPEGPKPGGWRRSSR
jgi:predicted nucleic acid-binding Zn ribbon protein